MSSVVVKPGRTVVVGAGAIGLATAYELAKRGEQITLIDSGIPGAGCTAGNAGWICPSIAEPLPMPGLTWISLKWMLDRNSPLHIDPLAAPGMASWLWRFWRHCNPRDFESGREAWTVLTDGLMESFDRLAAEGVKFEMHTGGLLFVFLTEGTMRVILRDVMGGTAGRDGGPRVMLGAELRAFEPALLSTVTAGFWIQEERHVRPETLASGLLAALKSRGAKVLTGTTVSGGVADSGGVLKAVRTSAGEIEGDRFVIAAGARSGELSRAIAGVPLPIQAGKGYSITVSGIANFVRRPLYLEEARTACTPFDGGYRFAGTMELSGVNDRLVPARIGAIRRAAEKYLALPECGTDGVEWVGMRPLAPDGLPVMGRLPRVANVFVATGHAMLGVTTAPTTGRLMADLILGGDGARLKPLDPARFG